MRLDPESGNYFVKPLEYVTIKVTAVDTPYQATWPPAPTGSSWDSIEGPTDGVETRVFQAPATLGRVCRVVIVYDFVPDENGGYGATAAYNAHVSGSEGGGWDELPVQPPPVKTVSYAFEVREED